MSVSLQGALTNWRAQTEGLVRIQKESGFATGTYQLECTDGGTCQDTERKQTHFLESVGEGLIRTWR